MTKVRAMQRGYFGGKLRDLGEVFHVPDDIWQEKDKRPSWVQAVNENREEAQSFPAKKEKVTKAGTKKEKVTSVFEQETSKGNGVEEELGRSADWLPPNPSTVTTE